MQLEAGLDTGPVYATRRVAIGPRDTAGELRARLVEVGTQLLVEQVPLIAAESPVAQAGEPMYAEKLTVEEFELDPRRPAIELDRLVRGGNPRPGAWMQVGGRRVKVWRARSRPTPIPTRRARHRARPTRCWPPPTGVLVLDEVQPEGKRAMPAAAWRAGVRVDARVDAS